MPQINRPRPLKVCHPCRPLIYQDKGLGERLGQGVGEFWHCKAWSQASADQSQTHIGPPRKPPDSRSKLVAGQPLNISG
jgi:hypothetical protein